MTITWRSEVDGIAPGAYASRIGGDGQADKIAIYNMQYRDRLVRSIGSHGRTVILPLVTCNHAGIHKRRIVEAHHIRAHRRVDTVHEPGLAILGTCTGHTGHKHGN